MCLTFSLLVANPSKLLYTMMVYMLLFLIFSVFVANPINLLYTVANTGRNLLNMLRISDHTAAGRYKGWRR